MCNRHFGDKIFLDRKKANLSINQSANNTVIREEDLHLKDNECLGEKNGSTWPRPSSCMNPVAGHIRL